MWASRLRVCYQPGLPRLVSIHKCSIVWNFSFCQYLTLDKRLIIRLNKRDCSVKINTFVILKDYRQSFPIKCLCVFVAIYICAVGAKKVRWAKTFFFFLCDHLRSWKLKASYMAGNVFEFQKYYGVPLNRYLTD